MCESVCVCIFISSWAIVHMGGGLSHVPLVLTTESGEELQ